MPGEVCGCEVPPPGWYCTRAAGHEGPCAAYQVKWFCQVTTDWDYWDFGVGAARLRPGFELRLLVGPWLLSVGREIR